MKPVVKRAHVKNLFAALVLLLCTVGCTVAAFSQEQPASDKKPAEKDAKTQTAKPGAKPAYTLTVKTRPILNIIP